MIGQTISHYRITEKLGKGGMKPLLTARADDRFIPSRPLSRAAIPDLMPSDTQRPHVLRFGVYEANLKTLYSDRATP